MICLRVLSRGDSKLWKPGLRLDISEKVVIGGVCNVTDVGIFMETDKERLVSVVRTRFPSGTRFSGLYCGFWSLAGQSMHTDSMVLVMAACKASAIFGGEQK